MKKLIGTKLIMLYLCIHSVCISLTAQNVEDRFTKIQELSGIEEYLYEPNGLSILLVQDNSAPVVTVQIVYRVGSFNEVVGNTGSTHLLEHLNFKGTPTFNKKNGTSIFSVLQDIGAQMNATTWNDRTNYFETIPSDKIELALHIESDRMRNSLLLNEDKDAEMTVVRNEFERGENNPSSLLTKEIWATAYMAHPYHNPTIGWRSDIENMPIEVLRDFYNTYYWPNNATLTIIGDYKNENIFKLIDKYFGKIIKAPHEIPKPYTTEPEQLGPKRLVIKRPGQQSMVSIAYKIPGRMHEDIPALEVLSQIIGSGTSSMISKSFIDKGIVTNGYAGASNFREVGLFTVTVSFTPDKDPEEINRQLLDMVEKVKEEGALQEDIDRIISKLNARTILSRDGSGSIASQLNEAIAAGDWTDYIKGSERLSKVTPEDVKRVANTYLLEDQSTTGYFIPKNSGMSTSDGDKASATSRQGKSFFRAPETPSSLQITDGFVSQENLVDIAADYDPIKVDMRDGKFIREKVVGIDVVTAKTKAEGFMTVAASFPIDSYINTMKNEMVASLTVQMLNKGTKQKDKFQFTQRLEKLGVVLGVNADANNINISFKCLSEDIDEVISLLAEELREPLFDAKEFELLKQRNINGLKSNLTDPGTLGRIALSHAIYPLGHPNYITDIETSIKEIEAIDLDDLKAFHKMYFGTKGMHFVAVGDVDTKKLYNALKTNFKGWNGGNLDRGSFGTPVKGGSLTKVITIPEKPSAEMFIGQYTGIERNDADYLPFYVGTSILGGGFSGRLMQTVRDNDGLTYGISAGHSGHTKAGGYWSVNATFNPSLFERGLEATMVQIRKWVKEGITAEELVSRKANIIGSYKVSLSTTSGMARSLLNILERGLSPDYLDQFPKEIEAVTLKEVNQAVKKYIDLDKLIIVKSGSLDENGNPLE